jgi:hypothetical protein
MEFWKDRRILKNRVETSHLSEDLTGEYLVVGGFWPWQASQWIAKQQLDRQGTKCFWRGPVGQQKSAQRHEGTNVPSCGVLAGTEDDRLRQLAVVLYYSRLALWPPRRRRNSVIAGIGVIAGCWLLAATAYIQLCTGGWGATYMHANDQNSGC